MADLYLERIGLARPTIVERDNNGEIERLESRGLDIASLVAFWRRCFDLNGLLFEKIILHCKSKDFNAMGGRTLATCRSVREILAEQGVECVIDDEWFKERDKELNARNAKQAELEAEIERLKADNAALKIWNDTYTEENEKLKIYNDKLCQGIYWGNGEHFSISIEKAKQNAVKEFVDKLQKELPCRDYTFNGNTYSMILTSSVKYVIDKLLKEYEQ